MPDDPRWSHIEEIYDRAADLDDAGARARFLDEACAGDAEVRAEVEALLAATPDAAAFFGELRESVLREDTGTAVDIEAAVGEALGWSEDRGDAMLGAQVGPWRLVRHLGHGGMGMVYYAEREGDDFQQRAALKLVRPGMQAGALARFHAERRILGRLEHPHIARLLDGGMAADGQPYLAMEFAEGEPITDYCDRRRLRVDERLALFQQVCEAVAYAHRALVVHRDLKPGNVFVTEDAVTGRASVKLLDFGIAKLLDPAEAGRMTPEEVALTQEAPAPLTPAYAAPEQVRPGLAAITTATDVYALGVLLFELLTGQRPYRLAERDRRALADAIVETEAARPSSLVTQPYEAPQEDGSPETVSPAAAAAARGTEPAALRRRLAGDLDRIVLKALRKEPARRYGSAEALGRDVARHLAGHPVEARPATAGYRTAKFIRRHRVGVVATGLVALALLGGAGVALWQAERAEHEAALARAEARKAQEVTDFVTGLFEASDPIAGPVDPDTLTARHLLAKGLEQADALAAEPETQAALLYTIALTYNNLGLPGPALEAAERTVALHHATDDDVGLVRALLVLGAAHSAREAFPEAEEAYREAIVRSAQPAVPTPLHASALNHLAVLQATQARMDEAEPLYRRALEIYREEDGPESEQVALILHNLGSLHHHTWELDEAIGLFEESIAIRRRQPPSAQRSLWVGASLTLLAHALRDAERPADAEAAAREALALLRDRLPPEHDRIMDAQTALGSSLVLQGEFEEAFPLLREAAEVRVRQWGEDHWRAAAPQAWLGFSHASLGRYAEGEPLLLRALDTVVRLRGPDDVYARLIRGALVEMYGEWGKPERAAALVPKG